MSAKMRTKVLILLLVAAIVGAACGGGSPTTSAETGDAGATKTSPASDGAAPAAAPAPPSGVGGFCGEVARIAASFDEAEVQTQTDAENLVEAVASAYEQLLRIAPDEIRDDVAILAAVYRDWADAGGDLAAVEISEERQAQIEAAGERIDAYLLEECGLDLDEEDEEFAGEVPGDPLSGQSGSLTLAGAVEASETYRGYDVSCWLDQEGLALDMYPPVDGWAVNVFGVVPDVRPGTYGDLLLVVTPPAESEMADEGDWFETDQGVLVIEEVGTPEDVGDGYQVVSVTGTFSGEATNDLDGSMNVGVTGTFDCAVQVGP